MNILEIKNAKYVEETNTIPAISLWNTRNFALDIPEHLKNTIGLYEGTTQGVAMAVRGHVQAAFDK